MRTQTRNLKSVWLLSVRFAFVAAFIAAALPSSMACADENGDAGGTSAAVQAVDSMMQAGDSVMAGGAADSLGNNGGPMTLREKNYYYQAFNRRDPFQSLIDGEFEETELELVDIYAVKLVGVLSGGMDKYAMLEDKNGFGYIVKAGDPVRNGSIVSVGEQALVARLTMFGQTNSVTLRLEGKKGKGE